MKVLMLSTDENIFKEDSSVFSRILDYGKLVEELHVVIKSSQKINRKTGNVFLYSTNSYGLFYFWSAYKISQKILVASGQWLITSQDPFELGLFGYFLKIFKSIPLQIQVHTDFLSPYFWQESVKNKIRVILGKWLIKKADGIRVVSERIRDSLSSKLQVPSYKIIVLPIFIDIKKIKESPINIDLHKKYPNRFIILMASRLTKEKNISLGLEAMKEVVKEYPEALLLVVGSGHKSDDLKLQVIRCELQDFVVFEDWSNDLVSYYKTADLFLLTSNYEGYGMTIAEATIAGLPVVMTDVGLSMGVVSAVGDYKDIARNIIDLIKNPEKKETILKKQEDSLSLYGSKEEYLNLLKASWVSCLSVK